MTDHSALLSAFKTYLAGMDDPQVTRFMGGFDWDLPARALPAEAIPVMRHFGSMNVDAGDDLLQALSRAAASLHWGRTYTSADFGGHFLQSYGWVELFGSRGHFASDMMAGGFLMLGPDTDYPDHHHIAEEIYIPLTAGSLWSKDGGAFTIRKAGEVIHHPSGINHAMKTQEQPLAALYLWRGGLLSEKPKFEGDRR